MTKRSISHELTRRVILPINYPWLPNGIEDMELAFEFYDKDDKIIKTESISDTDSSTAFELPKLID